MISECLTSLKSILISQDIDNQLRTAAEAFLENDDGCMVDSGKKEVRLSQIFKWYKADFGGTDEKVVSRPTNPKSTFPKHPYVYSMCDAETARLTAGICNKP